jgi:uncharacterized membrane protein YhaH (DUF805 family)
MSIVQQRCPACAAPLPIQPGERRLKCVYCGSALSIERHGDEISVELAEQVLGKIEQSGAQTQAEFQRIRLTQELHAAEMRLAHVQGEMRSIQRGPMNAISRTQLNEIHQESLTLQKQIADLKRELDPDAQPAPVEQARVLQRLSPQRLIWMLFTFDGRATRAEFWIGAAITFGIFISLTIVSSILRAIPEAGGGPATVARTLLNLVLFVQMVAMVWTGVAIGIKRFHDRDKPGWWVLIALIPVIGLFWIIFELGIQPGTPGPNRYG